MTNIIVRNLFSLSIGLALCAVGTVQTVQAEDITGLFNTGTDASNVKVSPGNSSTLDLHFTSSAGTVFVTQTPRGEWVKSSASNYIAPTGTEGTRPGSGPYTGVYSTTFTLPNNADLNSVAIAGRWSTDDVGDDILINGVSTGLTSPGFGSFTNFTLPTGSYQAGANTLTFNWHSIGSSSGIDVEFTTKTFAATPEPGATALLLGMGVSLVGFARRRRR